MRTEESFFRNYLIGQSVSSREEFARHAARQMIVMAMGAEIYRSGTEKDARDVYGRLQGGHRAR